MDELKSLGGETWFQLGDKDIALHLTRRYWLAQGLTLSEVTDKLAKTLAISHPIIPMSDEPVRTIVKTPNQDLPFQHYFVKHQCAPVATGFHFDGINEASPSPKFQHALDAKDLSAIVICPSNPFVSVDPILALPDVRAAMMRSPAPVIAVSPIIGGQAIKGPAAKMMAELNVPCTPLGVAQHYEGLLDGFVIDETDRAQAPEIEQTLDLPVHICNTLMTDLETKIALAKHVLQFATTLKGQT